MEPAINPEEFYKKLRAQLQDTSIWPSVYLYKFIVRTKPSRVKQIEVIFDNMGAVISTRLSKNGKYTSLSVNVHMKNPDAVIEIYKQIGREVEGVISL